MKLVTALLQVALCAQAETFVPSLGDVGYNVYQSIKARGTAPAPPDNLPDEMTGEVFDGRFWIDGETTITSEDDQYYFWNLASVHSPRMPGQNNSKLSLFG